MSSQSLKRQGRDTDMSIAINLKAKPGKLKKIKVYPSHQLDINTTGSETKLDKNPTDMEGEVPPLTKIKNDKVGIPEGMEGVEGALEVDEAKTQWSSVENGHNRNSPTKPHRRRYCPDEACIMRLLITLAFIFSLINFVLTLMILFNRGVNKSCTCQEKNQALGKVLVTEHFDI